MLIDLKKTNNSVEYSSDPAGPRDLQCLYCACTLSVVQFVYILNACAKPSNPAGDRSVIATAAKELTSHIWGHSTDVGRPIAGVS